MRRFLFVGVVLGLFAWATLAWAAVTGSARD